MLMTCNLCKDEGITTQIPHDSIGVELMKVHLLEKHNAIIG